MVRNWQWMSIGKWVIVFISFLMLFPLACRDVGKGEVQPQVMADVPGWPIGTDIPLPTSRGNPPKVPDLAGFPDAASRAELLLEQHPVAEVRQDFNRLANMAGRKFRVVIARQLNYGLFKAGFALESGRFSSPSPTIAYDGSWLMQIAGPEDVLQGWLATEHELQHWKQWAEEEYPAEAYLPGEVPRENCAWVWKGELAAYTAQCRRANSWGAFEEYPLCGWVENEADFRHALFELILRHDSSRAQCHEIWAQLAGHPAYQ